MTQETSQKPKTTRGAILGQFLAAQKLQNPAQSIAQAPAEGQVGQGRGLNLDNVLGKVDEMRLQVRQRAGFKPGMLVNRRSQRRSEFLEAFSRPRTVIVNQNPETKQEGPPTPPPTKSMFACPWGDSGCTFTTDNPDALKAHVAIHTRAQIKTF